MLRLENGVMSGTVFDTLEDMFCVKDKNVTRWLPYDFEKAGPYGKLHDYYDEIIDFYR